MIRPLCIEFAGALYHFTSRGDGRELIFLDDADQQMRVDVLIGVVQSFNWALHAYCLMDKCNHLLIEIPEANMPKGMRQLNGVYA